MKTNIVLVNPAAKRRATDDVRNRVKKAGIYVESARAQLVAKTAARRTKDEAKNRGVTGSGGSVGHGVL